MRTARLVGPTADGTSVVLVTEDGEELSVAVDPDDPVVRQVLRQAQAAAGPTSTGGSAGPTGPTGAATSAPPVRRSPPRRETPMDTPLSPRDIQVRIRAGESLEDLVAGSGMDAERVERFAAPVLAEREHLALTALGSSVRRRGEASGHRPLRAVVAERLRGQGVDADDVSWDAWKRGDGQWQVSGDYELKGEPRHAEFRYDAQGRFSVAEDDEARWLAGEAPSPVAAVIDRDDELALVRATREPARDEAPADPGGDLFDPEDLVEAIADELAGVLQVVPPVELSAEELDELAADDPESDEQARGAAGAVRGLAADDGPEDEPDDEPTLVARRDEAAEPTIAVVRHLTRLTVEVDSVDAVSTAGAMEAADAANAADAADAGHDGDDDLLGDAGVDDGRSALDTLYDMLGGYAEESPRVYSGLSDAAAVPQVDEHEFEPASDVLVPAEPEAPEPESEPETPEAPEPETLELQTPDRSPSISAPGVPASLLGDVPGPASTDDPANGTGVEEPPAAPVEDEPEPLVPSPGASRKPGRRKRASVPSWDEIMFGGPKPG